MEESGDVVARTEFQYVSVVEQLQLQFLGGCENDFQMLGGVQ